MERRYRRTYAGRPGYPKREDWLTERKHVQRPFEPIGKTARAKLTEHAIRHARGWFRAAGIRPPADPEALLATYLNRQSTPAPASGPPPCACGCGQPVKRSLRGRPAKWHSDACRKRARRAAGPSG
ncbi:MAG: hypothetical protein ACRDKL_03560 [Solirubrobacteraceae bacterium]